MVKEFFRAHFWVVKFGFLLSASYLMAQTTTQAARVWIASKHPYRLPRQLKKVARLDESKLQARFAILNKSNLFDPDQKALTPPKPPPTRKVEKPKDPQKKVAACDPKGSYRPSNLPLQLKGTSIASDPAYSVAAIYDARRRKIVALRAGDLYFGIRICSIEKEEKPSTDPKAKNEKVAHFYVKLDRGQGQLEYLESGRPPGSGRGRHISSMYATYRKLRSTKINLKGIKKKGKGRFQVNRSLINTLTQRLDWVGAQAAIVPYFHRGKPVGFRVTHIRRNSLYTKLGIKNGDVIKRINGYEFTSPQKALEAYSNLMSAGNLSVEILRRGKAKNLSYDIKE